jgi:hypothetical protein
MTTRLQNNPPPLPRAAKRERFPEVSFKVLHARVIEAFEARIPITHGGGYTIRGYGTSWVNTTMRDELSVWLRDHETGQQHKMDFGSDFLPMRMGHDVTLLWANGQLVTIANHTTGQIKYPALNRPILDEKPVCSLWFHVIVIPFLLFFAAAATWTAIPGAVGVAHGLRGERLMRHLDRSLDVISRHPVMTEPAWSILFVVIVLTTALTPSILAARRNRANRRFNLGQRAYLDEKLRTAENRWVRQYVPPRAVPW